MAGVDNTSGVTSSQIISSTSKTSNTKQSNMLNMQDFLSLLVAEMQNQDPLEPTSNSDYMAQMATFSQVEATSDMNERVLSQTASNLIGKAVIVKTDTNSSGYAGGIDKDYYEKWNNAANGNGSNANSGSSTNTDNKTE